MNKYKILEVEIVYVRKFVVFLKFEVLPAVKLKNT